MQKTGRMNRVARELAQQRRLATHFTGNDLPQQRRQSKTARTEAAENVNAVMRWRRRISVKRAAVGQLCVVR